VYEGRGQLAKAMKDLMRQWMDTKGQWDDAQSRSFEETFLIPLESDLKSASSAMDHIGVLLGQMKRDCQE
jgi:hypothetical protein